MKKVLPIIIVIIIFVLAITTIVIVGNSNKQYLKELTVAEYKKKVESKETFVVYIKQNGCSHCEEYAPIITSVLGDNKYTGYYINLSTITEEESKTLMSTNTYLKEHEEWGTPTTFFYKDGVIISTLEGTKSATYLQSTLESLGYIKK